MNPENDDELRALFRRGVDPLVPEADGFDLRVLRRFRERGGRRHHPAPRLLLSAAVSLVLVVALVGGFIITRPGPLTQSQTVLRALTSGATAAAVPDATSSYAWLAESGAGSLGFPERIAVLDWTGAVRHRFSVPDGVVAVSPDGTRALLADGRVIDQTGRTVSTSLAYLRPLLEPDGSYAQSEGQATLSIGLRWATDDSGLCLAGPPGWFSDPASAVNPPDLPSRLAIVVAPLGGALRTVTTVDVPSTGQGTEVASPGVDACDPQTDTVVLAAETWDTDASAGGPLAEQLWSVQMSTGALLYQASSRLPWASTAPSETPTPSGTAPSNSSEVAMLIPPYSFGAANGSLVGELVGVGEGAASYPACLPHGGFASAGEDVRALPSGRVVRDPGIPACAARVNPLVYAMSADGSRFLQTYNNPKQTETTIQLVAVPTGDVVRSVEVPTWVGGYGVACPSPNGAFFMVLVDGYLVLVDSSGGISQLFPGIALSEGGAEYYQLVTGPNPELTVTPSASSTARPAS